ncbi:hypothetical protein [Roseibium marinum]|uniref:Uncharacterized protein n=1 Tax=Roseibium marinum TaxID=281252 RepID=A0A2S3UQX7_9HYPH|nr:hypothetical protein [Roseibium marinum]POF30117.1 hypothetical protein CLV41_107144 [Roseibium marinum]
MSAVDVTAAIGRAPEPHTGMPEAHAAAGRSALSAEQAGGNFSFGDFLDVINPLQHIPGIAELYRSVTNDRISDDARKAGNAFYGFALGGPVGLGAMLAYSAAGDRWAGSADENEPANLQVADASKVPGVTESSETDGIPVPARKPELTPEAAPEVAPGVTDSPQGARTGDLLGQKVASIAEKSNPPLVLSNLLSKEVSSASAGKASAAAGTGASSVSYVDGAPAAHPQKPALPDEQGLGRLATHKANHLPLDVLKALQERHAQRTASERS